MTLSCFIFLFYYLKNFLHNYVNAHQYHTSHEDDKFFISTILIAVRTDYLKNIHCFLNLFKV